MSDEKVALETKNPKAGARALVHLQIVMVVSWYLVWQTMMRWLVFRMLKVMQRKLVK